MLTLLDISKSFPQPDGGRLLLFEHVSFTVEDGVIMAVLGPNGCGKTTLFRLVSGEISPDSGSIELDETPLDSVPLYRRSKSIGRVHQDSYRSLASDLTIREVLSIAAKRRKLLTLSFPSPERALAELGEISGEVLQFLKVYLNTPTRFLSGGERQLLAIAICVLGRPRLILLDEHTASLDDKYRREVDMLLKRVTQHTNASVLCITHDQAWARRYVDSYAVFRDRSVVVSSSLTELLL